MDSVEITQVLNKSAKQSRAITEGSSIVYSILTAISLYFAFAIRNDLLDVNVLDPFQTAGLLLGAMIPFKFSSLTLNSVVNTAFALIEEIKS